MFLSGLLVSVLLVATMISGAAAASPEITVASVFGDHMVLQRDKPIRIWGRAAAGESVSVELGERQASVAADERGQWKVALEAMPAGGPHKLVVQGESGKVTLGDILIGELWLCSGQSNMEWPLFASNNGAAESAAANHPAIRLFTVEKAAAGEPQDLCNGQWAPCTPETAWRFSGVAYFFGRMIHQELEVPIGLIHSSWGGTPAQSWTSRPALESEPMFALNLAGWDQLVEGYPEAKRAYDTQVTACEEARLAGEPVPPQPTEPIAPDHPWRCSALYNAMIAPLTPLSIAGVIWYQGESNVDKASQYSTLFPLMIRNWRSAFEQGDFPFLFVQLVNHLPRYDAPQDYSAWAELREAQLKTLGLPNTAMAVAIDLGEANDIHPQNKQDVGERLALAALAKIYGRAVAGSGPILVSSEIVAGEIRLQFKHTDGGLVARGGNELVGFVVAGVDKHFVWADARIEGSTVIIRCDEVPEPIAVRYAWADNPACNLYNGAGLPASPFRTDDWPGVTSPKPAAYETLPQDATVFRLGLMPFGWTRNIHGPFGFLSDNYCAFPGGGECSYRWDLVSLAPGRYRLSTWVPVGPDGNFAMKTPFKIYHDGGATEVVLERRGGERGWHELGEFAFSKGAYVEINNDSDGFVFADALMVTPVP